MSSKSLDLGYEKSTTFIPFNFSISTNEAVFEQSPSKTPIISLTPSDEHTP